MKDDMPKEIWVSKRQLDKDTFLLSFEDYLTSGAVRYTRAALDRVIEGDGWLPIETLPADCKPLGNPRYLTYHKDWGYGINGEQMLNGASPTHCWPLPTPPEAE